MFHIRGYPILLKAEVRRSFITTTVLEQPHPRSHNNLKGATGFSAGAVLPEDSTGSIQVHLCVQRPRGWPGSGQTSLSAVTQRLSRCGPGPSPSLLSPSQSQTKTVSSPGPQARAPQPRVDSDHHSQGLTHSCPSCCLDQQHLVTVSARAIMMPCWKAFRFWFCGAVVQEWRCLPGTKELETGTPCPAYFQWELCTQPVAVFKFKFGQGCRNLTAQAWSEHYLWTPQRAKDVWFLCGMLYIYI